MGQVHRWRGAAAAALLLPLVAAGCTGEPAAAAAVVGEAEIELTEISDQLLDINEVLGLPPDAADAQRTNAIVTNNIVYELIEQGAGAAGVTVSQTEVELGLANQVAFAGSEEALAEIAAQAGLAPDMIETDVRANLLAEGWAATLADGEDVPRELQQQLLVVAVRDYSATADTTVNPRFGVWDATSLSVVEDPEAPSARAELTVLGQL